MFSQTIRAVNRVIDDMRRGEPVLLVASDRSGWLIQSLEVAESVSDLLGRGDKDSLPPCRCITVRRDDQEEAIYRLIDGEELGSESTGEVFAASGHALGGRVLSGPDVELASCAEQLLRRALLPLDFRFWVCSCEQIARLCQLGMLSVQLPFIEQPVDHPLICMAECSLPMSRSDIRARLLVFRRGLAGQDHVAAVFGCPGAGRAIPVRVHSCCLTGDVLGSLRCDCGEQLQAAVSSITQCREGILLYLNQEGRGIGLVSKIRAYALQDEGLDTVAANRALGYRLDERIYRDASQILRYLGVGDIDLLTNNPAKVAAFAAYGITVRATHPIVTAANPHNEPYLRAKRELMGHQLP